MPICLYIAVLINPRSRATNTLWPRIELTRGEKSLLLNWLQKHSLNDIFACPRSIH